MENKIVKIVAAVIIFGIGIWLGRKSKICPKIEQSTVQVDTIYQKDTIKDIVKVSYPVNKIITKTLTNVVHNTDTMYIKNTEYIKENNLAKSFLTTDVLSYKDIHVAVTDSGTCDGIFSRKYKFYGDIENKIITRTITNTITRKVPLFSLYGGITSTFTKDLELNDIGPMAQLSIKQKCNIGYGFMIKDKNHNFNLTYKLR